MATSSEPTARDPLSLFNYASCRSDSDSSSISSSSIKMEPPKLSDFHILKVLGKGAYGKVFQVRKKNGMDKNKIYAMKSVNKSRIMDSRTDVRHTRTERDVLVQVDHPFLIKLFYAFENDQRIYFVQEFCKGGELFRLMETERMLMEYQARFYLSEIVCALEYLHTRNIVYRDLKTENIMLDAEGHIKLIDFGLSKILDDKEALTNTFCGTVEYMAPEIIEKTTGHGMAADWWSLGIFTYDLLTGRSPFHSNRGKKETKNRILRGRLTIPQFITREGADFIQNLLRRRPERRLGSNGATEVKLHPFFDKISWSMVENRSYQPPFVPDLKKNDDEDTSQFDPRFTSRTPRESIQDLEHQEIDAKKPISQMFAEFDYISEDCILAQLKPCDSGIGLENTNEIFDNLHIRSHGD